MDETDVLDDLRGRGRGVVSDSRGTSTSVGGLRRWSRGPVGPLERVLLVVSAGFAVLLVLARTVLPDAAPGPLLIAASSVSVGLAVVALVAAWGRMGALHGDGEWSRRVGAMQGTSWRQRRVMIRALREGLSVAADMREPAVAYTWMRGAADRQLWMPVSIALMQAALAGRDDAGGLDAMRVVLIGLCALAVTVAVLNAARWRRIGASFLVRPDGA